MTILDTANLLFYACIMLKAKLYTLQTNHFEALG